MTPAMPVEDAWLLAADDGPAPGPGQTQIYCFPPAGADPRSFLEWQPGLDGVARVIAICLPGRWHRAEERAPAGLAEAAGQAARAIAATATGPYLLFGHSMGAIMAFEAARRLTAGGLNGSGGSGGSLRQLVVSGCNAPRHNPSDYIVWSDGNHGRVFAREAASFLGLPPEFSAADDEVQELLLADLRADVHLFAEYRYEPAAPLPVPITAICGRDDPHADPAGVRDWAAETRSGLTEHWADGDHFYLDRRPAAVLDVLRPLAAPAAEHIEVI